MANAYVDKVWVIDSTGAIGSLTEYAVFDVIRTTGAASLSAVDAAGADVVIWETPAATESRAPMRVKGLKCASVTGKIYLYHDVGRAGGN